MTGRIDVERVLDAFLAPDHDDIPDRVLEAALADIARSPQRRAWRAPWRYPDVSSPVKLGFAAAVVVIAAGAFYLSSLNGSPSPPTVGEQQESSLPTPGNQQESSRPTASPSDASPAITLRPGLTGLMAFSRVAGGNATILVARPDGSDMATLVSMPGENVQPAWSPDGTRLAWATVNGIRVATADGRNNVLLTSDGRDRNPAWSPDGSFIVFSSSRDGSLEIYTQAVDGDELNRLTDNDVEDDDPSWSPVTNQIAFVSARGGTRDIWTMKPDGGGLTRLTDDAGNEWDPAWSPDGTKMAFASDREGGTPAIYLMNADGSGIERRWTGLQGERDPAWSPDGRFLAFARSTTNSIIVTVDPTTGEVVGTVSQVRAELSDPAWQNP